MSQLTNGNKMNTTFIDSNLLSGNTVNIINTEQDSGLNWPASFNFIRCKLSVVSNSNDRNRIAIDELSFVDCVINLTEMTRDNGRVFGAENIEFKGCTFIGSIVNDNREFIHFNGNVNGGRNNLKLTFIDCKFDLDTDWNRGGKSTLIGINDLSAMSLNIIFTRCYVGQKISRSQNLIVLTKKEKNEASINIAGRECGISINRAWVSDFNRKFEEIEKWNEVIKDTNYKPTSTTPPSKETPSNGNTDESGEDEKEKIPYKIISIVACAAFALALVVLIIACIKKKKYDRSE